MRRARFDIRDSIHAAIGVGLFLYGWMFLAVAPVAFVYIVIAMPLPAGEGRFSAGPLGFAAIIFAFLVVTGLLLKWFARGVVCLKKARTIVAAVMAAALGTVFLLTSLYAPFGDSVAGRVNAAAFAFFAFVGAGALVWVILPLRRGA